MAAADRPAAALIELRRHAGRHGGSLQRLRERSAAWSQPQCPSRAMWLPLSANSGQRRAGEGAGGPASAAVPSCPSWSRSSAQLPQDRCTTAARSGIGALGTRGARVWPPWAAGQCADGSFRPRRAWIEALLPHVTIKPAINQCAFSIAGHAAEEWGRDDATVAACKHHNITFEAYSPLGAQHSRSSHPNPNPITFE